MSTLPGCLLHNSSIRFYLFISMCQLTSLLFFLLALCPTIALAKLEIPIEVIAGTPYIYLPINGHRTQFMLDTGSNISIHLNKDIAESIEGLRFNGRTVRSIDLAGNVSDTEEFIIPNLQIDKMLFHDLKGVIRKPWGLQLGAESDTSNQHSSVLGLGFFKGKKLILDLAHRSLSIFEADENWIDRSSKWIAIPFHHISEGMVVNLRGHGASYQMILDSAATLSMVKSSSVKPSTRLAKCSFDLGPERNCQTLEMVLQNKRRLHPILMDMPNEFGADGILGTDFLAQLAVAIDMPNRRIFLLSKKLHPPVSRVKIGAR